MRGLLKEGGSSRVDAVGKMMEKMSGKLEVYYFAFGETDVYCLVELPDNVTASAASLIANAAGTSNVTMTVLISPEEVDRAVEKAEEKSAAYLPPGQ